MSEREVKKRDMGIGAFVIVASQLVTTFTSSDKLARELDELKKDVASLREDNEEFASRSDLKRLNAKLDAMRVDIKGIKRHIRTIQDLAQLDKDMECSYRQSVYKP